jgi:phosphomannomutase
LKYAIIKKEDNQEKSMEINPKIFKAYDIRGIYPREINQEVVFKIGQAFIKFLKKKKPEIVVGRDNRLSSPKLFRALIQGMIDQGAKVIDIGLSTTPMVYWATSFYHYDGGIEITASHNPPEYNGLKLVKKNSFPLNQKTGLKEIKRYLFEGKFKKKKGGEVIKKDVIRDYLKFNLKNFDLEKIAPLKIVIDTANSVSGNLIPLIFKKTNCQIYHLFAELDGSFPNHPPDPLIKENLQTLCFTLKKKKADLGIAFDGDGDRICFVDEKGEIIRGDLISTLMAKEILKENPGEKILYDLRSSNILKEKIQESGGIAIMGRVGHSFIKEKMRKENIIFAGEFSGHYYHRDYYFCECPIFVLLKILEIISIQKKPFSQIIKPFKKYFHSGEINFKTEKKEAILKLIEKRFRGGKISKIDGLRIDFPDWWFLIRPSQTEPVLRLVIEAKTRKLFNQRKKELIHQISSL